MSHKPGYGNKRDPLAPKLSDFAEFIEGDGKTYFQGPNEVMERWRQTRELWGKMLAGVPPDGPTTRAEIKL